ncbi:MAG: DUF4190 domain-containing protein [Herbiconiux sp.]|uniref:DUF4190 domain-containing protein n=1 Tax=Herbiconiux sp. TaxID=1871186 RepID=UPI001213CE9E|nr:DUF4190 domain-containing protein [Herbiconiux sp.]TAJ48053.1 MAG: DUF4190 domain-containing protein [Herbiconiux sp.]
MTDENQPPVPPQQPVPPAPPAAPQYQAAPPAPPAAPQYQPAPTSGGSPATFPGKGLGIAGLIVAIAGFFVFQIIAPIAGLIMSIIARKQSREAGFENGPAKAGIIVSIIALVIGLIIVIIVIIAIAAGASAIVEACQGLGPGVHEVNGVRYTCS